MHNQKNVLQKEIKRLNLWSLFTAEETSSWFLLIESLKMTCARSYASFLNFLSNGAGLNCFSQPNILPKLNKLTWPVQSQKKGTSRVNFDGSVLNCSNSAKWPVWKSIYLQLRRSWKHQIWTAGKPHSECSIGYSTSGGPVSLAHNHVTNLFISVYWGATVIKFGK